MKAFKVYPFTIGAGFGSQVFLAEGSYFRIKTAAGDVGVSFDDNTNLGPINAGQGFKVAGGYRRLTLTDMSGAANTGTIIVAGDDFVDQQLSGVVQVVDGEKARTLAGAQFGGSATSGSSAGNTPKVQLWNPVGSGKNLIVRSALVSAAAAATNTLYHALTATQLATPGAGASVASSKFVGGAVGVGLIRTEDSLTTALATAYLQQATFPANVTQMLQVPIFGAIVVPPGKGLLATCSTTAVFLSGAWEWFEEAQ